MILLIDNYDSFVYNLARYFARLGQETHVVRNDRIDAAGVRATSPAAIVLSPGPCAPPQAGCSLEVVRELAPEIPMLGVCLGHQVIAEALGGRVVRAAEPVHGRTSWIEHDGRGLFTGMLNPFQAARYHSLVVDEDSLPGVLQITARTPDSVVMAIAHRKYPLFGLQFHPESILTEPGYDLLAAFLGIAGIPLSANVPSYGEELKVGKTSMYREPDAPVTF